MGRPHKRFWSNVSLFILKSFGNSHEFQELYKFPRISRNLGENYIRRNLACFQLFSKGNIHKPTKIDKPAAIGRINDRLSYAGSPVPAINRRFIPAISRTQVILRITRDPALMGRKGITHTQGPTRRAQGARAPSALAQPIAGDISAYCAHRQVSLGFNCYSNKYQLHYVMFQRIVHLIKINSILFFKQELFDSQQNQLHMCATLHSTILAA